MKDKFFQYLGIEPYRASHTEKLVSALGAFLGILLILYISTYFLHDASAYLIVASMGASAVLLFAVPHGPLSQPWPLIGGHLISAFIGVSCARFIPDSVIAASLAVGLAVGLMYYLHCIHPPGGATALSAVVSGGSVHELGYQYILTPVLINAVTLLAVAISFNFFFKWRRYPVYLARKRDAAEQSKTGSTYSDITHEDFVSALSEFESFLDISEHDLLKIYELVTHRQQQGGIDYLSLKNGHYYSNGEHGKLWSVRQIVDWAEDKHSGEDKLIYKIIAGENRRSSGVMTKNEFARWAKHEVERDEGNWRRIETIE
jgi:CBS domain-containing membrane protein